MGVSRGQSLSVPTGPLVWSWSLFLSTAATANQSAKRESGVVRGETILSPGQKFHLAVANVGEMFESNASSVAPMQVFINEPSCALQDSCSRRERERDNLWHVKD